MDLRRDRKCSLKVQELQEAEDEKKQAGRLWSTLLRAGYVLYRTSSFYCVLHPSHCSYIAVLVIICRCSCVMVNAPYTSL